MNKIFIVGRLTRDPELRTTPSGVSVCNFSVAVNRRFDREKTDFFNVVVWRQVAENCARYLVKGQQVAVEGELQMRSYEAKDGTMRTTCDIAADQVEFLAKAGAGGSGGADYSQRRQAAGAAPRAQEAPKSAQAEENVFEKEFDSALIDDNDLPF